MTTAAQNSNNTSLNSSEESEKQLQEERDRAFLVLQFHALREEILALKERVIRVQTIAISGIPLMVAAGEQLELDFVILVSPIITAIAVLMLSFEWNSIMRAGRYIRKHIEPNLKSETITGWEGFLQENEEKNRDAEKHFSLSVIIVFALYYLGGTLLAFLKVKYPKVYDYGQYKDTIATVLVIFYITIFPFCISFVAKSFKTGTGDNQEQKYHKTKKCPYL